MKKLELLESLQSEWKDCTRCPLALLRKQVVFGSGNPDARIVMIGESPGEDKAADLFNRLLASVGISRNSVWTTNVCLCRPVLTKPGKKVRAPHTGEISACLPRLIEELEIIAPEIIILAGNTPLNMATGKRGITKNRGWQDVSWTGTNFNVDKVYATLHPDSLLYGSKEQKQQKALYLHEDWLEITRVLLGKKKDLQERTT